MKNLIYLVLAGSMFNPLFVLDAKADRWSGEAVSAAKKSAVPDGSKEPSAADAKNGAVTSPYLACQGVMLYEPIKAKKRSDAEPAKREAYWNARKTNCDASVSNCSLKVQSMAVAGTSVVPFLETVRQTAVQKLSAGVSQYETVKKTCFEGSGGGNCESVISGMRDRITKALPEVRFAVAMMATPTDKEIERMKVTGDYSQLVNKDLSKAAAGFVQIGKMEPLTSAEYRKVQETYERLVAKARKDYAAETEELLAPLKVKGREVDLEAKRSELNRGEGLTRKIQEAFAAHRAEMLERYSAALTVAPEAAYIGSANASKDVMTAGLTAMIADQTKLLNKMKEEIKEGTKPDLSYAGYSSIINTMVEADMAKSGSVSMCGPATQAHMQLKDREFRNGLIATGVIVGSVLASGGVAGLLYGSTAAASTMAVAGGLVGTAMTAHEVNVALDSRLDARTGLTTHSDSQKVTGGAVVSMALSPLNFIGTGAVAKQGLQVATNAAKSAVTSRFAAAAVARGELNAAGVSAEEVSKLAATATVKEGATASKEATAAAAKLETVGNNAAKEIFGHAPTAADEAMTKELAEAGMLGTVDRPNVDALKTYTAKIKGLSEAERAAYDKNLKAVSDIVEVDRAALEKAAKGSGKEAVSAKAALADANDPARAEAVAKVAMDLVDGAPDPVAAAAVLKPGSGYDAAAVTGIGEVVAAAKALGRGVKETVATKAKNFITKVKELTKKATGRDLTEAEARKLCICAAYCPVKVAHNSSKDELMSVASETTATRAPASFGAGLTAAIAAHTTATAEEPFYMACIAPTM